MPTVYWKNTAAQCLRAIISGMLKEFIMRKILERKLGTLPEGMREKILQALKEDPEFFANLARDIEAEKKSGKNETAAAVSVLGKHRAKLQELLR